MLLKIENLIRSVLLIIITFEFQQFKQNLKIDYVTKCKIHQFFSKINDN